MGNELFCKALAQGLGCESGSAPDGSDHSAGDPR